MTIVVFLQISKGKRWDCVPIITSFFNRFFSQPAAETKSYDPLELPDDFSENTQMLLEEEEDTVESPTLRNQRRYTTDERDDDFPSLMMRKAGRCISNPIFPCNYWLIILLD